MVCIAITHMIYSGRTIHAFPRNQDEKMSPAIAAAAGGMFKSWFLGSVAKPRRDPMLAIQVQVVLDDTGEIAYLGWSRLSGGTRLVRSSQN